jgi:hypothetical protein
MRCHDNDAGAESQNRELLGLLTLTSDDQYATYGGPAMTAHGSLDPINIDIFGLLI